MSANKRAAYKLCTSFAWCFYRNGIPVDTTENKTLK